MSKKVYYIGEDTLFEDVNINKATIKEALEYLEQQSTVSLDIETTKKFNKYGDEEGLSPYLSKIVMFQIGTLERQYIIDVRNKDISVFKNILESKHIIKVGHNLKFEYLHLLHNYNIRLKNLYDTMLVEQILYNGYDFTFININSKKVKRFSLEALIYVYTRETVNKDTRLQFLNIGNKPFTLEQIFYGADDIIYPLQIMNKQAEKIKKQKLQNTVVLEMLFLEALGNIEYRGLKLDKDKWSAIYKDKLKNFLEYENKLNDFVINNYPNTKFVNKQLSLFDTNTSCNIKWTSSKQVIDFLKYLNACPQEVSKTTKKLEYTVNAKILKSSLFGINREQPDNIKNFINVYLKFKELEQATTTFGIDFFKYINPVSGRLHSSFKQIVNTGRSSSTNPNVQNIPSDKVYRECFVPEKGNVYVNCDYGGQETVVLANFSKEANIVKLINEGGDMHSFVASQLSNKPYEDFISMLIDKDNKVPLTEYQKKLVEYRQTAKAAGFAINYGGNGFTIAKNLGIEEHEGNKVYEAYFKAFPTLKQYFDKVQTEALSRGYILIDKITNRKRYFHIPKNPKEKHSIMKNALNTPIQGTSGSMTKLACIYLTNWLEENNLLDNVYIVNVVHDELLVECKEEYKELIMKQVEKAMLDAANIWCKDPKMKAEAKASYKWEH